MLRAAEYLGEVGVGATSPLFFRADDDRIYVVKVMKNPLGSKILASEHIAACFGRLWDLPFPDSDFFTITEKWLQEHSQLNDTVIAPGIHFASYYLENASYVTPDILPAIHNRQYAAGMILFDHLFHNGDRAHNRKNMLLLPHDTGTYTLYGIDHSHLFHSGRWTDRSLDDWAYRIRLYDQNMYGSFLSDWIYADDFIPCLHKIEQLKDSMIKEIICSVPYEWLPDIKERKALLRFLRIRLDLADAVYRKICRRLPPARGGCYEQPLS